MSVFCPAPRTFVTYSYDSIGSNSAQHLCPTWRPARPSPSPPQWRYYLALAVRDDDSGATAEGAARQPTGRKVAGSNSPAAATRRHFRGLLPFSLPPRAFSEKMVSVVEESSVAAVAARLSVSFLNGQGQEEATAM